jgi:hypothetical protein
MSSPCLRELRRRSHVDPEVVAAMRLQDPEQVFVLAFQDSDGPFTSRQLIEKVERSLPEADVSS